MPDIISSVTCAEQGILNYAICLSGTTLSVTFTEQGKLVGASPEVKLTGEELATLRRNAEEQEALIKAYQHENEVAVKRIKVGGSGEEVGGRSLEIRRRLFRLSSSGMWLLEEEQVTQCWSSCLMGGGETVTWETVWVGDWETIENLTSKTKRVPAA